MRTKNRKSVQEATRDLRELEGQRAFHLDLFGDFIAEREGYKQHDGMDALHFYLVQKYHWLPAQARALNWEDLHFLFAEEMSGWNIPKEFRS